MIKKSIKLINIVTTQRKRHMLIYVHPKNIAKAMKRNSN